MTPTLKPALKQVILDALKQQYTSTSCHKDLPTGNRYQSVVMGDEFVKGGRNSRSDILDRVNFTGQTVLDLGSNLGELSRYARRRGAALVDGVEYDGFFVEIANLLAVYNDQNRVTFRQGDITSPSLYREPYDVVLAFSVFEYLKQRLPELASITRKMLLLETHKTEGNLESAYIEPIGKLFPMHRILGTTDWGTSRSQADGSRVVVAFARDESTLDALLGSGGHSDTDPVLEALQDRKQSDPRLRILDLERSLFMPFEAFRKEICAFPVADWRELSERLKGMDLKYRTDPPRWLYWAAFARGFLEFYEGGTLAGSTSFFTYVREFFADKQFDPNFAHIVNSDEALARRLHLRYTTMMRLRCDGSADLAPVRALKTGTARAGVLTAHLIDEPDPIECGAIDGYHRIFSALLAGVRYLPAIVE